MANDRAKQHSANPDVSEQGLGDDLRSFLAEPVPVKQIKGYAHVAREICAGESHPVPKSRQLRPGFRATPGDTTGFPGTSAFSSRSSDSRAAGATVQPARPGNDLAPASPKSSGYFKGWRSTLQQAGADSGAVRAALAADARAAGGDIRGRVAEGSSAAAGAPAHGARACGRPPGSGKQAKDAPGAKLPAAIQKLVPKTDEPKAPPKLIPTENERASATRLFREIGQRFNDNRKKSKTAAYAGFRHDLMDNLDTLVMGGAIDLKEATSIITNLEQYTKETEAESTETPATILGRWLRMDAAEIAGLSAPVEEVVEDEEIGAEDEDKDEPEDSEGVEFAEQQ